MSIPLSGKQICTTSKHNPCLARTVTIEITKLLFNYWFLNVYSFTETIGKLLDPNQSSGNKNLPSPIHVDLNKMLHIILKIFDYLNQIEVWVINKILRVHDQMNKKGIVTSKR